MTKLPKHRSAEIRIEKEFVPIDPQRAKSAGRMIVRSSNYGESLKYLDQLYEVMLSDALRIEPPIELAREDVSVIHFAGERYARTFGIGIAIPERFVVPDDYIRVDRHEASYN
jgi:hypothetical protein